MTPFEWDVRVSSKEDPGGHAYVCWPGSLHHSTGHYSWERGLNENTNGLIREYLHKGTEIMSHQPYLNAIAEELNDRPRASLGFYTPREAYERLLVASTS